LVLSLEDRAEELRITELIFAHNVGGAVVGGIVVDNNLHGKSGFLYEETVQTLRDELLVIVGDAEHAHQGPDSIRPLLLADPNWVGQADGRMPRRSRRIGA